MRFCTTCGRNFENEVGTCPHDGTPLFDMGVGEEPLLAEASEPWGATSASEVSEAAVPDRTKEFSAEILDESDSVSKEFPGPTDLEDLEEIDSDATVQGVSPLNLENALFEENSSDQIAEGIDDILGDEEEIAPPTVDFIPDEEPLLEDELSPIEVSTKSGGSGWVLPIILLVIVGLAAFYFVGGGKELLSPAPSVPDKKVKKVAPKKVEPKKIEPKIEPKKVEEAKPEIEKTGLEKIKERQEQGEQKKTEEKAEKLKEKTPKDVSKKKKVKKVTPIEKAKITKEKPKPVRKKLPKKKVEKKEVKKKKKKKLSAEDLLKQELERMNQ